MMLIRRAARVSVVLLVLILCKSCCSKRNELLKGSSELLEKESTRLSESGQTCSIAKPNLNSLAHLRISKQVEKGIACHIKYLQSHKDDGWVWSSLAAMYSLPGQTSSNTMATTCFKQAAKLSGKVTPFIKQWSYLGPFVIGKAEVDGDPVQALGGIREVSKTRLKKGISYVSELAPDGVVTWSINHQASAAEGVRVAPQINWNDLITSLGSMGITEWQGWVVGEFAVNENNLHVAIQCHGVHTVYVDDIPITGDVYHRGQFAFSAHLNKGIHLIYIRLRAKGIGQFRCSLDIPTSTFEILTPHFLPDLYDGYLFGRFIALPVSNHHTSKWLKNIKVTVSYQSEGSALSISQSADRTVAIAPGQVRPVTVELTSDADKIIEVCKEATIKLKLSVHTSEGDTTQPITLRCRTLSESFLFTFLDHDGSVQQAAAVHPIHACDEGRCPVVISLHGTTVPPQNQADSYKRMVGSDFLFGVDKAWLLAPSRHGAHNWEGPGALTAVTALTRLVDLVEEKDWLQEKGSYDHTIVAGHSMGGHGAWHLATHYPDRVLAVVSLAGWLKKEEYGDSNLFFRHDIATPHVDPAVKAIMEACIAENEIDRHVSNLAGINVLARIGANDRTIHPFFVRRAHRLLQEAKINATFIELPGKEHWWWDTWETNDGGAVNDRQIRDFTNLHAHLPKVICLVTEDSCHNDCIQEGSSRYSESGQDVDTFTYTLVNPAFGESVRGIQILQQDSPFRVSKIIGKIHADSVELHTSNVARFKINEPANRPVGWGIKTITIDGKFTVRAVIDRNKELCVIKDSGAWLMSDSCDNFEAAGERGPLTMGPARRVAESKFLIITGTQSTGDVTQIILELAVYIANLFFLTSDTLVSITRDIDITQEVADRYNVIVLGNPEENSYTAQYLEKVPLSHTTDAFHLSGCSFEDRQTGAIFLAPHGNQKLALVLLGNSIPGLRDVVSLATPTIPPMTRSPFSNMVPDYIVTGPAFRATGPGGYLCAGFWGNHWEFLPEAASCSYCKL